MFKIRYTRKRIIFSLVFIFILAVTFYIGGAIGYYQGSDSVSYLTDSEAFITSLSLSKLRNEDYDGAVQLLETRLDKEIMQCTAAKESQQSIFNLYWLVLGDAQDQTHISLLSSVADYRAKYPSLSTIPEVQQQIETVLKKASKQNND